ncbi:hypothetical protein [Sphingobium boeckii]|uniref:Uncharacterized protein n=1 Tax=Sphingobium boeckii TaxID=1082345 RepID=A0A7W9AF60_9SPHN|nr:hypothetical protein [Sphingobium boeckii]MBB5684547.1 hypothetical protein [Sphingobium boeckii]
MERSEPIGFYNFGVAYLDTARLASLHPTKPSFSDPMEFLISHGLELIFKADLRRKLSLEKVRNKFGHNLLKMSKNLSEPFLQHFEVDDMFRALVTYLSEGHSGPNWRNRYLETGFRAVQVSTEDMLQLVHRFNIDDRRWLLGHFARHSE